MRTLSLPPRLAWPLSLLLAAALLGAVAFLIALPATTAQAQEPPTEEEGPPPGSPPPVPPLPIDGGVTGTQGLPTPPRPIFNSVTPTGPTSVTVTFWPQNGVRIYTVSYRRNRLPELFRNKSEPVTSSGLTTVVVTGLQCGVEYEFWGWSFGDGTTTASAFNDRPATGPLLATPACAPTPDRPGTVTLSDTTPQVGTAVTATLTDPDGGITNLTWQWLVNSRWQAISGAAAASYTPATADVGYRLRAAASYTDGHGPGKRAASAQTAAVAAAPTPDQRGTVTLSDTTPQVGTAVTATLTDPDGGIANLTWQWQRQVNSRWQAISGAAAASYAPAPADVGYRLRAVASYGDGHGAGKRAASVATATVAAAPPPALMPPDAPTGLNGVAGPEKGQATLTWDAVAGADGYAVAEWKQWVPLLPAGRWVQFGDSEVAISGTTAVVRGLTPLETHTFSVKAVKSGLESEWATGVDVSLAAPPVPEILTNTSVNHGEVRLTWDAVAGATGYYVEQKKPRLLQDAWHKLPSSEHFPNITVSIDATTAPVTAVITGLEPGKEFSHRVRSINVQGASDPSKDVPTTVLDQSPAKPTITEVNDMIGGRGIELKWDAATRATRYEVRVQDTNPPKIVKTTTLNAEITGLTPERTYTFTLFAINDLTETASDMRRAKVPTPTSIGHQEDHTVAYQVGSITSAPNVPSGVPDPATVIAAAINPAVTAWNTAAAIISGKNLKICKVGACGGGNHDGGTVTVKTVAANTKDTGDPDSDNHNAGCGRSVACVKARIQGDHLRDMSLIFEEPAWECRNFDENTGVCAQHARIYWTDKSRLDLHHVPTNILPPGSPPSFYWYVEATMVHEFGHTLGLPDFYNDDETMLDTLKAVMNNEHVSPMITDEDIAQLEAIYAVHDSIDH